MKYCEVLFYYCRYSLMFSCWNESAEARPTFVQIINRLEHLIAPLAQYMDFTELYVIMK